MDQLPLDGRLTDLGGFARLGAEGVDLLMSDSTNAEIPGIVTTERAIGPVLNEVFDAAKQRIIVSCFASHVHRVQQALDAAAAHGRKVALVGRSMVRNMGVARELGYLRVPSVPGGLLVELREAEELPPDRVVLISTGSQGEPMSALARMAGPGPPDQDRRGRHGDPGLVAGAGERDRGVPGHQRADPAGRAGGAQGQRAGARVRARARRRAALRAEPGAAEQLHPGARGVAAPAGARRARRADRRAGQEHRDRRGRRGGRPGGRPGHGLRARARSVTCTWTGCRSARSPRRR